MMGQQRPEWLKARVDALHSPALIAVGDFAPHAFFLLHVVPRQGPRAARPVDAQMLVVPVRRRVVPFADVAATTRCRGATATVWRCSGAFDRRRAAVLLARATTRRVCLQRKQWLQLNFLLAIAERQPRALIQSVFVAEIYKPKCYTPKIIIRFEFRLFGQCNAREIYI